MMKFFPFLILLLAAAAPAARAQEKAEPSKHWTESGDSLIFRPAQMSLPRRLGPAQFSHSKDISQAEEGLDSAVLFRSPDGEILATVYVYMPSLAHPAVQRVSTVNAIAVSSEGKARLTGEGAVAAAGVGDAALTADHQGYLNGSTSLSAFVKAGRWLIKVRISGPPGRTQELAALRSALLDGLRFKGRPRPRPLPAVGLGECPPAPSTDARLLAGDEHALVLGLTAAFDPLGEPPRKADSTPIESRVGARWCRADLEVGRTRVPLLRSLEDGKAGLTGRSELMALYSDAGGILEIVRLDGDRKTYAALRHAIGRVEVLGAFDGPPSPAQLRRLLTRTGEESRVRSITRLKADGNSEVTIAAPAAP